MKTFPVDALSFQTISPYELSSSQIRLLNSGYIVPNFPIICKSIPKCLHVTIQIEIDTFGLFVLLGATITSRISVPIIETLVLFSEVQTQGCFSKFLEFSGILAFVLIKIFNSNNVPISEQCKKGSKKPCVLWHGPKLLKLIFFESQRVNLVGNCVGVDS